MPLPTDITQWGQQDAKTAVTGSLHADFELNRLMLEEKDFWGPSGDFWAGERTGDPATDRALLDNIKPQFAADDILSEILENYADGLLQREASIMLDPVNPADEGTPAGDTQQADIEAKLRALAVWWDQAKYWRKVRMALKRSRYAPLKDKPTVGRGALRFWVPPGSLVTTQPPGATATKALPTGKTLAEAFALVAVDDVRPDAAALYTDPTTRQQAAVILTTNGDAEEAEVWTLEGTVEPKQAVRRLLTASSATGGAPDATLNLRGHLPLAEVEGDILVTQPVRQLQSILNLITTTLPRTVSTAGFKERYITNAEPPGMWLPYPPANSPPLAKEVIGTTTFYKHRVDWKLGAHITSELIGIEIPGKPGEPVSYATPGVTIAEPTDPAFVTKAQEAVEGLIYKRCRQGHLANTSTAEASGIAYAQARSQFEADLGNMKGPAEGLIRDSLEILCAYAALMSQEARDLLANYRIVVTLHPHAGPITADEARLAVELRTGRVISSETAMARVGVEDTAAELAAIDADPIQQMEITKRKLEVLAAANGAGLDMAVGAHLAGFDAAEVQMIVTGVVPGAVTAPALADDEETPGPGPTAPPTREAA